jgi:hypothetical protein
VSVTFNDGNEDQIPQPARAQYQAVIQQAIETSRPAGEDWAVTTRELVDSTVVQFDFGRGLETPISLTFAPGGDDVRHSLLFQTGCRFLRHNWPGAIQLQ